MEITVPKKTSSIGSIFAFLGTSPKTKKNDSGMSKLLLHADTWSLKPKKINPKKSGNNDHSNDPGSAGHY